MAGAGRGKEARGVMVWGCHKSKLPACIWAAEAAAGGGGGSASLSLWRRAWLPLSTPSSVSRRSIGNAAVGSGQSSH